MLRKKIRVAALATMVAASMAFTGCGSTVNTDAVLVTLDGEEKTVGVANFITQYYATMYDSYYISYFGEDMWDTDVYSSGSTMSEDLKSDVLDELQELYLLEEHMDDYGVTISDDEEAEIQAAAQAFMDANSKKAIKYMGATQEIVSDYLRLLKIKNKMETAIKADVDTEVSDDIANQKTVSYISIPYDYEPTDVSGDDAEDTSVTETADDEATDTADEESSDETEDDITEYAKNAAFTVELLSSEESLEDIASEYTDFTVESGSFGEADLSDNTTDIDLAVLQAANTLTAGQLADDVVAGDDAYYVVRLDSEYDEEATQEKIDSVISEREDELYDEVLQGYKDACEWVVDEKVWATVNFDNFYTIVSDETEDTTEDSTEDATDATTEDTTDATVEDTTDATAVDTTETDATAADTTDATVEDATDATAVDITETDATAADTTETDATAEDTTETDATETDAAAEDATADETDTDEAESAGDTADDTEAADDAETAE